MIKVTEVKDYILPMFNTFGQDQGHIIRPVVEAELVLIECSAKEGLIAMSTVNDKVWIKRLESVGTPAKYYKPVLISKTETIEKGDWIYDELENSYFQCSFPFSNHFRYSKILALPEHFSIELLNLIVDKKIKHEEKILIECTTDYIPEMMDENEADYKYIGYYVKLDQYDHVLFHSFESVIKDLSEKNTDHYRVPGVFGGRKLSEIDIWEEMRNSIGGCSTWGHAKGILKSTYSLTHKDEDEWISVEDRLPEEGGRYWCYVKDINDLGISYYQWNCSFNPNDVFKWTDSLRSVHVTHWRKLPPPPKFK